jgi:C4-dicarboxylate transporter, DctM subunit
MLPVDEAPKSPIAQKFDRALSILVTILGVVMVTMPVVNMLARIFANTALPSAALIAQNLTLWIGCVGALLAATAGKHLSLSTSEAIPKGTLRNFAGGLTQAVSASITALLASASIKVVQESKESERILLGSIPQWWSLAIMPIALGLIALQFAWKSPPETKNKWVARIAAVALSLSFFALAELGPKSWVVTGVGILLAVAFLAGAPVFVAVAGAAMLGFWIEDGPIASVPEAISSLVRSSTLPAIPLLTLAGYVLAEGGAAKRLVRAFKGFFGWLPGGVAVMATLVCAIFTTFTGGSGVTILAVGGLLFPMMKEEGYPEGFSHGLLTASGSLGLLFFPSLPVILYAVVAEVPMEKLYLGGLVPGLLMIGAVCSLGIFTGIKNKIPRTKFDAKEALAGLWGAKWDLGLPLVIGGLVLTGVAPMVEAAACGCSWAFFVELVIFRSIHPLKDFPKVMASASTLIGAVIILLGAAMGLSAWFVDAEIPQKMLEWTQAHISSAWVFLLALNVGLLIIGSVLEIYAAIVVLAPLVAPIGAAYGIDPVHLGIVFLANIELGLLFPPMGLNLLLAASRFQKPLPYFYARTAPFLLILAVSVLGITYMDFMTTGVIKLTEKKVVEVVDVPTEVIPEVPSEPPIPTDVAPAEPTPTPPAPDEHPADIVPAPSAAP